MQPLLGLAQPEPRPPLDDLDLVCDPVADHLVQPQRARHSVDQGEHDDAERVLQLRVLIQVVQHDLGDRVALEHDHEPLPRSAAGLVAHVRDAAKPPVLDELGDLSGQVVRVDLEWELLDDQALPAADLLVLDNGPHGDRAAPGPVRLADAAPPHDQAVGREVRALDVLHEPVKQFGRHLTAPFLRNFLGALRAGEGDGEPLEVVQVPLDARGDLAQVMRRDLRRHADGDALGAVDQQVGESGGQNHGLCRLAVVVRPEVDSLLVDVPQHLHGERGKAALGVPHGGGRVVAR